VYPSRSGSPTAAARKPMKPMKPADAPSGADRQPGVLAEFVPVPGYRRPALTLFISNAVATVAGVAVAITATPVGYLAASLTAAASVGYGVAYLWRGRFRTLVTTRGVEARGYRTHLVPWDQVHRVETGGYLGPGLQPMTVNNSWAGSSRPDANISSRSGKHARLATVKVVRTDGSSLMLPAPLVTSWASDPAFVDKVALLQRLASQHAGLPPT
jgi:hypothetical protein